MKAWKVATLVGLVAFSLLVLVPFWWIASMSFKTYEQIQFAQSIYVPRPFTWENYTGLWLDTRFPLWFRNSAIVATATTAVALVIAALAAYSFSRFHFAGNRALSTLFLLILFPVAVIVIPLFMLDELEATNTYGSLIITYLVFSLPISTWLLIGFFNAVPVELEEAAMIDGSSRMGALWRITLPLSLPGLAATAIYVFTLVAWNEFFFALTFMNSQEMRTIPVGLTSYLRRPLSTGAG